MERFRELGENAMRRIERKELKTGHAHGSREVPIDAHKAFGPIGSRRIQPTTKAAA